MSKLGDSLQTRTKRTENNMAAHQSTLDHCVDLFFQIGAMRGQDVKRLIEYFSKAYNDDPLTAMKILFWARDVRGGAGERQVFRDIIQYLANNHTESLRKNLEYVPEFGRWDDLLVLTDTKLEKDAFELIRKALEKDGNALCAKWMPRPNVRDKSPFGKEKKKWANKLRNYLGYTPKQYRKLLAESTNVVENKMCANNWSAIEYDKIPSRAMSDYTSAFRRNDQNRFEQYIENLKSGDAKVNAEAVYPYDVIKNLRGGNEDLANEQWKALPNWMEGGQERIMPVIDTSGSMTTPVNGNPNVRCLDVSISLGIYISERNEGEFKDEFITFSERPELQKLNGDLKDRYRQIQNVHWGFNTDIEKVFSLILQKGVENNLSQEDMPTMVLIISDMEFDMATDTDFDSTVQEAIEDKYREAGYETPKIVYWNLQSRNGHFPVQFDKRGVAMVSGLSPSIVKSVISGEDIDPRKIMLKTIESERYKPITV